MQVTVPAQTEFSGYGYRTQEGDKGAEDVCTAPPITALFWLNAIVPALNTRRRPLNLTL